MPRHQGEPLYISCSYSSNLKPPGGNHDNDAGPSGDRTPAGRSKLHGNGRVDAHTPDWFIRSDDQPCKRKWCVSPCDTGKKNPKPADH